MSKGPTCSAVLVVQAEETPEIAFDCQQPDGHLGPHSESGTGTDPDEKRQAYLVTWQEALDAPRKRRTI